MRRMEKKSCLSKPAPWNSTSQRFRTNRENVVSGSKLSHRTALRWKHRDGDLIDSICARFAERHKLWCSIPRRMFCWFVRIGWCLLAGGCTFTGLSSTDCPHTVSRGLFVLFVSRNKHGVTSIYDLLVRDSHNRGIYGINHSYVRVCWVKLWVLVQWCFVHSLRSIALWGITEVHLSAKCG